MTVFVLQAIAREEKGFYGVDYNKSKKTYFRTTSFNPTTTTTITEGDTLSLPCEMTNTLWTHNNEEILYITTGGNIMFSSNVDLEVEQNGTHLIIKNVRPEDAGVRNQRKQTLLYYFFIYRITLLQVTGNRDAALT